MPSLDFAATAERIGMERVLDLLMWRQTDRYGRQRRGPCPVHGSRSYRSRSLSVGPRSWYCHVCRACGDCIDLYAQVHLMTPFAAAIELCERLALRPVFRPRERRTRRPRRARGEAR